MALKFFQNHPILAFILTMYIIITIMVNRENNMNKSDKGFFSWFALLPFGIFCGFLLWMVCTYDTAASVVKIQVLFTSACS